MSGWVTLNWSNSGNFPPGVNAWNGQPLALLPVGTWFTPNTFPEAEEFNYLFGNVISDLNFLFGKDGALPALNWPYRGNPITATSGLDPLIMDIQWHEGAQQWLGIVNHVTNTPPVSWVVSSLDSGVSWQPLGSYPNSFTTTGGFTTAIAGHLSTVEVVTQEFDGANPVPSNAFHHWNGSAWTSTSETFNRVTDGYFVGVGGVNWFFIGPGILPISGPPIGTMPAYVSLNGTSWTDVTDGSSPTNARDTLICSAVGGANLNTVLVMGRTSAATQHILITFSAGAPVYSYQTKPASNVTSVAWSIADQQWVMSSTSAFQVGNTQFWTSPDGIAWTARGVLLSRAVTGLTVCNQLYVATTMFGETLYTLDPSLNTWKKVPTLDFTTDPTTSTNFYFRRPTVRASTEQFMRFNGLSSFAGLVANVGPTVL